MSLVLYPDSSSDEDVKSQPMNVQQGTSRSPERGKRKRSDSDNEKSPNLPPLPAAFHDLYSTNARISTSDDPSLHGGRKRAIPHVEGNWPSHVYLELVPSQSDSRNLYSLIDHVRSLMEQENSSRHKPLAVPEITPSLISPLGAPLPLHISLSRTLQIKTDDREAFVELLTPSIRKAAVGPFRVQFSKLKWVPNYERNRWFLVLQTERPVHDELNKLLGACNDVANKCGHPGLYVGGEGDGPMESNTTASEAKKRRTSIDKHDKMYDKTEAIDRTENFHISIAWNLIEPDPEWTSLVRNIDVKAYLSSTETSFDAVKARVGNVVHNVGLGKKPGLGARGGLLGLG